MIDVLSQAVNDIKKKHFATYFLVDATIKVKNERTTLIHTKFLYGNSHSQTKR